MLLPPPHKGSARHPPVSSRFGSKLPQFMLTWGLHIPMTHFYDRSGTWFAQKPPR